MGYSYNTEFSTTYSFRLSCTKYQIGFFGSMKVCPVFASCRRLFACWRGASFASPLARESSNEASRSHTRFCVRIVEERPTPIPVSPFLRRANVPLEVLLPQYCHPFCRNIQFSTPTAASSCRLGLRVVYGDTHKSAIFVLFVAVSPCLPHRTAPHRTAPHRTSCCPSLTYPLSAFCGAMLCFTGWC